MKKLLAILLALSMVLALGTVVFAEETGSITVENAKSTGIYNAYKIFDVEVIDVLDADDNPVKSYLYTIDPASPWYDLVEAYAIPANGLALSGYDEVMKVEADDTFSAADFAAYLKAAEIPAGATAIPMTVSEGKATATGLEYGYYFVTSSVGVIAALTTTDPDATIIEKNPFDFDKTEDNDNFDIGDSVTYTVVATIPGTEGIDDYVFKFTDEMTEGLDYNNDMVVEVVEGETVVATFTKDTDYTVTTDGTHKFVLVLNVMSANVQEYAGKTVRLTYSATLNEAAVAVISVNEVVLEFGRADNLKGTRDDVVLYSSEIVINKYEKGDDTKKLAGAEFVLYKEVGGEKKYYKLNGSVVEWVDAKADATVVVTDDDGKGVFPGLADGEYFLEETKAPAGYALLADPVSVTLAGIPDIDVQTNTTDVDNVYANGGETFTADLDALSVSKDIENATGSVILPATGGIGTTLFYVVGALLLFGAAITLFARKRANELEEAE